MKNDDETGAKETHISSIEVEMQSLAETKSTRL